MRIIDPKTEIVTINGCYVNYPFKVEWNEINQEYGAVYVEVTRPTHRSGWYYEPGWRGGPGAVVMKEIRLPGQQVKILNKSENPKFLCGLVAVFDEVTSSIVINSYAIRMS